MKLLLVVRWPVGGLRTYLKYIYSQSFFEQYEITLIAPDLDLKDFIQKSMPAIHYFACDNTNLGLQKKFIEISKKSQFDIIHLHGFSAGALITSIPAFFHAPILMTAHDLFQENQFRGIKGKVKLFLLNLIYARLNGVLTVSKDSAENYNKFMSLFPISKIKNIDHGVDAQRFALASPRDFSCELEFTGTKLIGFFGRFMSPKGFLDLVKAMKLLLDSRGPSEMPTVLTFGWGGFIREDYALIEQLGLSNYFRQLPFTDDVPAAIKGVDMVVMPSRWEACGLLAMEVLCAGVPLIATNCVGLRCVVEGTPARVVDSYSPDQLAFAIEQELNQPSIEKFKDYKPAAIERFNFTKPARELDAYYQVFKR